MEPSRHDLNKNNNVCFYGVYCRYYGTNKCKRNHNPKIPNQQARYEKVVLDHLLRNQKAFQSGEGQATCIYCSQPAQQICSRCEMFAYCSNEHRLADIFFHQSQCRVKPDDSLFNGHFISAITPKVTSQPFLMPGMQYKPKHANPIVEESKEAEEAVKVQEKEEVKEPDANKVEESKQVLQEKPKKAKEVTPGG